MLTLFVALSAFANPTATGPFAGTWQEGFEHWDYQDDQLCLPGGIFDGLATACLHDARHDGKFYAIYGIENISTGCTLNARTGLRFGVPYHGETELDFTVPVERFGGYFGSMDSHPGSATVAFYGLGDVYLGNRIVGLTGQCSWAWAGFEMASEPIYTVRVYRSVYLDGDGTYFDDLEMDLYCAPGDTDCDGYPDASDCDPDDVFVNPLAIELCDGVDNDCNGTIDDAADMDGDGFGPCDGDCNEEAALVHPGADEGCDGIDTDCDGTIPAHEVDDDRDGYAQCEGDCDDARPSVNPDAAELCDGLDTDCDGALDPVLDADADGDGSPHCDDCDDDDATRGTLHVELCDGIDNDCDGLANADFAGEVDGDADGWLSCQDCDDFLPGIHPGATDTCDGIDDDCDGTADEDGLDSDSDGLCDDLDPCPLDAFEADDDADGICNQYDQCEGYDGAGDSDADGVCDDQDPCPYDPGDDADGDGACAITFGGSVFDCDDDDPAVGPLAAEICNGIDDNCDGDLPWDELDADEDGLRTCEGDCDDTDARAFPGAAELCDGVDQDCSGDGWAEADEDGDGVRGCDGDCDDRNVYVFPGAEVQCGDGLDNDCDGDSDEVECDEVGRVDSNEDRDGGDGGCNCHSGGGSGGWLAVLGALGLVMRSRRRTYAAISHSSPPSR